METVLFYVFAVVSVGAGVMVITRRNPVTSALWLVVVMFCLAALFLLLQAFFIAAVQVIVYAGAIMVLFLFVIMLLNLSEAELGQARPTFVKGLSVAASGILMLLVAAALLQGRPAPVGRAPAVTGRAAAEAPRPAAAGYAFGEPKAIGTLLFTDFLVPFEIASVLLLAAMVGGVVLARRELRP